MKEQLMKLKNGLKYHDFKDLIKEWKETFEYYYKRHYSDRATEFGRIWKVCQLLESIKAEDLAKIVLFYDDGAQCSEFFKEFYAFYILLGRIFVDSGMTKEEFFAELDKIAQEG